MAQNEGFLIQSKHKFHIDITPDAAEPTYVRFARGFSSFEPGDNTDTDQTGYLDGGGLKSTSVMGGQITLSFEGHRYYGDPAQDYIFSKQAKVDERLTRFKWEEPNGKLTEGSATIATIEGPSGEAGSKGEISVEIHFNGTPTITEPTVTP